MFYSSPIHNMIPHGQLDIMPLYKRTVKTSISSGFTGCGLIVGCNGPWRLKDIDKKIKTTTRDLRKGHLWSRDP
jgi:hypothetical protein